MDYKYNFTFIIPHKNLPDLLRRCVSSIPKRDDVQIIIVDDNSDPSIVDFDNFPFHEDNNIEIIFDKSGKRQGHARNIGIERAKGKWLIFADSDDYFFYSINKALDENINNTADIVYYMATILDNNSYLPLKNQECIPNVSIKKYLNGEKDGEHFVRFRYPAPWGKFIKSSVVKDHNIRFAEIDRLEDTQFSYQCGFYAKNIDVKDYSIYCYVHRVNSVTFQVTNESRFGLVKVCTDCLCFLTKNKLADSPTYIIMTDLIFNNLESMSKSNNQQYENSIRYLLDSGISMDVIKKQMRRMKIISFKRKILSFLRFKF